MFTAKDLETKTKDIVVKFVSHLVRTVYVQIPFQDGYISQEESFRRETQIMKELFKPERKGFPELLASGTTESNV